MKPVRSLLFVPGHREGWAEKAIAKGADGIILDLEDSVPESLKAEARVTTRETIRRLRENGETAVVLVRINPLDTGLSGDDIEAVAVPGLDGLALPKTEGRDDLVKYSALVDHYERRNGVDPDTIELMCNFETARSYAACEEVATASPRVSTLFAGTARDADVSRSIGFTFTPTGEETLYLRSRVVLASRAAGLDHPVVGVWQDLEDDEGARRFAEDNRRLGFRGQVLIHPKHIAVANEVFGPTPEEVDFYRRMIDAFEVAEAKGLAAVTFEGMHIDYAHIKTARQTIEYASAFDGANAGA